MHLGDFGSVAAKLPRCRVGRPHHWSISDMRQSSLSDNYGDSVSPSVRFGLPFERSGYIISPHTSTSFDPVAGPIRSNSIRAVCAGHF